METSPKVSIFRHIILKIACHHQYREIYKIEIKNATGDIVQISAARECSNCGNTKKVII